MVDIVFPKSSAPGERPQEAGGRLINAFSRDMPEGAPSNYAILRTPGLLRKNILATDIHTRGFLDCGATLLWAVNDKLYAVDGGFNPTSLGALAGTAPITMARNFNATPQNLAVTENGCFVLTTSGAPVAYSDPDLPASPTSVCEFDGYFIWTFGSGGIWASDLNQTSIASNSFAVEQGLFIRRGVRFKGRFFAFGDKWTSVWRDAGTVPFPLDREAVIPRGIAGTFAVAGWEVGWSNELIWVGDDYNVYQLQGYTPLMISTPDVARMIQTAALAGDKGKLEASVFMAGRNAFWALTYPGNWTWVFNLTTSRWHELQSYNRLDWKGRRSVRMFDRWVIGAAATGELFELGPNYFFEGVDPLIWEAQSGVVAGFPNGVVIPRASFHVTTGVGDNISVDPKIQISWSLDGGHSYGNPVTRSLGGAGYTKSHPYIIGCGLSRGQGVRFKLRVSDQVHVQLQGGAVEPQNAGPSG